MVRYEPAAGSVAFPRLRTGEPVDEFCERLVQKSGARSFCASPVTSPSVACMHNRFVICTSTTGNDNEIKLLT